MSSNFFKHLQLTKAAPLVSIVIFTVVALFAISQIKVGGAKRAVKDFFSYINDEDYEKAYNQFSENFFKEAHKMSVSSFSEKWKDSKNHKILSMDVVSVDSDKLGDDAQKLSFKEYESKKLFVVKYYGEHPHDTELYEENEMYCATPGVLVDAYFGVVQVDAFTWKILFITPIGFKCKGENKYAQYLQELKAEEEKQRQLRKIQDIEELINFCQRETKYEKRIHDGFTAADYFKENNDAFWEDIKALRKREEQAIENWTSQLQEFCTCSVESSYPRLSESQIEDVKNVFWANGIIKEYNKYCKLPDLFQVTKYEYSMYRVNAF